jgi:transposase
MAIPVIKPKALLADKGYDGDVVRENLLIQGILPIIPPKSNRREPIPCDFRRYRDRNRIERMFGHLKQFRRIATRYDKTALSFASFLNLAAIRKWLPHFVNAASGTWGNSFLVFRSRTSYRPCGNPSTNVSPKPFAVRFRKYAARISIFPVPGLLSSLFRFGRRERITG